MSAERDTGSLVLPEQDKEGDTSLFIDAAYDTRDDIGLPTRGSLIYLRYVHSGSWLGGEQDYDLAEGVFTKSFPSWRGDSFSLILGGGKELAGDLPPARDFRLGGIRSFPGLRFDELRGTSYWFAGHQLPVETRRYPAAVRPGAVRRAAAPGGQHGGRSELLLNEGTLYGIAGSLNGRTLLGPFILSLGYVDNDSWELQFTLGRPIPEGSALDAIH